MASALKRHFPIGKNPIYLPDFVITFLRTPNLPPTFAKFIVPLTFNKLDLRDYLFHVYGVNVLRVRSYVEQQKVQSKGKVARRWYRPRAIKKMTVEMDKPFIWPKEPDDFSAWDKETYDAANRDSEKAQEKFAPGVKTGLPDDVMSIEDQAKELLEGKKKWKPTWQAFEDER